MPEHQEVVGPRPELRGAVTKKGGRMQLASRPVLTRAAIVAAALTALLCLQPEPAQPVEPGDTGTGRTARALVLSDQARRYLALQYRAYPTEFLGCMIGELRGR